MILLHLFILEKNKVVTDYQNRFNELWQKNNQEKSDEWMIAKIYKNSEVRSQKNSRRE